MRTSDINLLAAHDLLESAVAFLEEMAGADMEDHAADAVTVGMVYQNMAKQQARFIRMHLRTNHPGVPDSSNTSGYPYSLRQQARWIREAQADPASTQSIDMGDIDADELDDAADVIEKLHAALNRIASWDEGEKVDGTFDEPHAARIAREALCSAVAAREAERDDV